MNTITFRDRDTTVTVETNAESIWDYEDIFAGILTIFGFHENSIYDLFHQEEEQ